MEGEAVLIALTVAGIVALVILRIGRRRSTDHQSPGSTLSGGTGSGSTGASSDAGAAEEATTDESSAAPARRRRLPRIPRQRRESPRPTTDPTVPRSAAKTTVDAELLRTLEEMAAHPQNRPAAVNLLRQRTGMNARQARRFINAL